jgi:hypothetical protein
LLEKAKPVPSQQTVEEKEPLQLGVQLLKRWRDRWGTIAYTQNGFE